MSDDSIPIYLFSLCHSQKRSKGKAVLIFTQESFATLIVIVAQMQLDCEVPLWKSLFHDNAVPVRDQVLGRGWESTQSLIKKGSLSNYFVSCKNIPYYIPDLMPSSLSSSSLTYRYFLSCNRTAWTMLWKYNLSALELSLTEEPACSTLYPTDLW